MKRIIPVASIVLTGLAAHSVYAEQPHGFIDYRHEYLDKKRTHADRVEFGTFFSNGITLRKEIRINGILLSLITTVLVFLLCIGLSRWMIKISGWSRCSG